MAYLNTSNTLQSGLTARITHAYDAVAAYMKQRRVYRQTLNELIGLSDRELADLGLSRSELRFVAKEAAQNAA